MSFVAKWTDLQIIILSEVSQTEKEKYDISYMQNLKGNDISELTYKTERDLQN